MGWSLNITPRTALQNLLPVLEQTHLRMPISKLRELYARKLASSSRGPALCLAGCGQGAPIEGSVPRAYEVRRTPAEAGC
jgi:hypothetical protein